MKWCRNEWQSNQWARSKYYPKLHAFSYLLTPNFLFLGRGRGSIGGTLRFFSASTSSVSSWMVGDSCWDFSAIVFARSRRAFTSSERAARPILRSWLLAHSLSSSWINWGETPCDAHWFSTHEGISRNRSHAFFCFRKGYQQYKIGGIKKLTAGSFLQLAPKYISTFRRGGFIPVEMPAEFNICSPVS